MITVKELRSFIASLPDDTKIGIDDDQEELVFRQPASLGAEILLTIGRLHAYGEYEGEERDA